MLAHLLQFDSTHGTYPGTVTATENGIVVDGEETRVYAEPDASKIPWVKENGVDIVLECTGFIPLKKSTSSFRCRCETCGYLCSCRRNENNRLQRQ